MASFLIPNKFFLNSDSFTPGEAIAIFSQDPVITSQTGLLQPCNTPENFFEPLPQHCNKQKNIMDCFPQMCNTPETFVEGFLQLCNRLKFLWRASRSAAT